MTELYASIPISSVGRSDVSELNDRAWAVRRATPEKALELAHEARHLAEAAGDERELARSLCTIGSLMSFSNDDNDAEGYLLEAQRLSETHGDNITLAWTLYGLVKVAFRSGDIRGALGTAMRTYEEASRVDLKLVEAHALNAMGAIYKELGVFQEALKSFRRSLDLFKAIDESIDESKEYVVPLYNINLIYTELGEYEQALTYAEPAFEAFKRNGDAVNAAGALMNIGELHSHLGRYDRAMVCLTSALKRFQDLDSDHFTAQALYHLGKTYIKMGDFEQARSSYLAALERYEAGRHDAARVLALIGLGELHLTEGAPELAMDSLNQALRIAGAKELKKYLYQVHHALSRAHKALGHLAEALDHFERYHSLKDEVTEEKLKSIMEGMQVQVDIEKEHHKLEVDRLTNRELAQLNQKLRTVSERLEEQNVRDELTKVYNRRHLNSELAKVYQNARSDGRSLSVVMCDIDHFKSVNDTFSHAVGDRVLRAVASLLDRGSGSNNMVARYGGEEFVLLLADTALEGALVVCERLRELVETYDWSRIHPDLRVTMSFGTSDRLDFEHYERMLNAADELLYRAKREGRNRVCG